MKSIFSIRNLVCLALLGTPFLAHAHCQIPCGIYDDELRFNLMLEHVGTIQKSIDMINRESSQEPVNYNQVVRWVTNKESHAEEIQKIACDYFLAQRIKEETEHYNEKLREIHRIIVYAMKTKQSLDPANVANLETAIKAFRELYFDHHH